MSLESLIVGLGNPGRTYEGTRHNIGFLVLDALASQSSLTFSKEKRREAEIARGDGVILVKPQTFMNLSGRSVISCAGYYKIPKERILVIYDEVDLPFGTLKLKGSGSAGGHNGMSSILQALGHAEVARLRVGIASESGRPEGDSLADFVLQRFSAAETEKLPECVARARDAACLWRTEGTERAMNQINRRPATPPTQPSSPPENLPS